MARPGREIGSKATHEWRHVLRAALNDRLVDVRFQQADEGLDFLIVYSPGARSEAIRLFAAALRKSAAIPPFDIASADEQAAQSERYRDYASVASA